MSALADVFTSIANTIRAKLGVLATYKPSEMPAGINSVYTAGENAGIAATKVGTAVAGDVLTGKTFTNSSAVGVNGSMPNRGSNGFTITDTSAVTIPAGYYNGSGKIQTSGMIVTPTATKSITSNGSHDVTNYAIANVNVEPSVDVELDTKYSDSGYASRATVTFDVQIPTGGSKYLLVFIVYPYNSNMASNQQLTSSDPNVVSITRLSYNYCNFSGDKALYGEKIFLVTLSDSAATPDYSFVGSFTGTAGTTANQGEKWTVVGIAI